MTSECYDVLMEINLQFHPSLKSSVAFIVEERLTANSPRKLLSGFLKSCGKCGLSGRLRKGLRWTMATSYISMVTDFKQRHSKSVQEMARGKDSDMLQNEFLWIRLKVSGELLLNLDLTVKVKLLKNFSWWHQVHICTQKPYKDGKRDGWYFKKRPWDNFPFYTDFKKSF